LTTLPDNFVCLIVWSDLLKCTSDFWQLTCNHTLINMNPFSDFVFFIYTDYKSYTIISLFLQQYNWLPRYTCKWNIVESGIKHHSHNLYPFTSSTLVIAYYTKRMQNVKVPGINSVFCLWKKLIRDPLI
jgi:hypothetical protein